MSLKEPEIEAIVDGAGNFTDENLKPFIDKAIQVRSSLKFEDRIKYLAAGLGYFAGNLPETTKKAILVEMANIAKADGVIHDNESALFKMAASYLTA